MRRLAWEAEGVAPHWAGWALVLSTLLPGCPNDPRFCENESCTCRAGDECDIHCLSPPCNLQCKEESKCNGGCANGSCVCEDSARCEFECITSPCHVTCVGNNECSGACANGTCECGHDSSCQFRCEGGPCHTLCRQGASCVVSCPDGTAGTEDCDIPSCAAGKPAICPGRNVMVCNARCP